MLRIYALLLAFLVSCPLLAQMEYEQSAAAIRGASRQGKMSYEPGRKFAFKFGLDNDMVETRVMDMPGFYFFVSRDSSVYYWTDPATGVENFRVSTQRGESNITYSPINKQYKGTINPKSRTAKLAAMNCGNLEQANGPIPEKEEIPELSPSTFLDLDVDKRPICRYYTVNHFINASVIKGYKYDTLKCYQICIAETRKASEICQKDLDLGLSVNEILFIPLKSFLQGELEITTETLDSFTAYLKRIKNQFDNADINYYHKDTATVDNGPVKGRGALGMVCNKDYYNVGVSYFFDGFYGIFLHELGHILGCGHVGENCGNALRTIMCDGSGDHTFGPAAIAIIRHFTDNKSNLNCVHDAAGIKLFDCGTSLPQQLKLDLGEYWPAHASLYWNKEKIVSTMAQLDSIELTKTGLYTIRVDSTLLSPNGNCAAAFDIFIPTRKSVVKDTIAWKENSMEQAILNCNLCIGLDTIRFQTPEGRTIYFSGETPPITDSLFIDGITGRDFVFGDSLIPHKPSVVFRTRKGNSNTGFIVYAPYFKMHGVKILETEYGVCNWTELEKTTRFPETAFSIQKTPTQYLELKSNIFDNCRRAVFYNSFEYHYKNTIVFGGSEFKDGNYVYYSDYWSYLGGRNHYGNSLSTAEVGHNFFGKYPGPDKLNYYDIYPRSSHFFYGTYTKIENNVFFTTQGNVGLGIAKGLVRSNYFNYDPYTGFRIDAGNSLLTAVDVYVVPKLKNSTLVSDNFFYSSNPGSVKRQVGVANYRFNELVYFKDNIMYNRHGSWEPTNVFYKNLDLFVNAEGYDCATQKASVSVSLHGDSIAKMKIGFAFYVSEFIPSDTGISFERQVSDTTVQLGDSGIIFKLDVSGVSRNARISVLVSDLENSCTIASAQCRVDPALAITGNEIFRDTQICAGTVVHFSRPPGFSAASINGNAVAGAAALGKGYYKFELVDSVGCKWYLEKEVRIKKNALLPVLSFDTAILKDKFFRVWRKGNSKTVWKKWIYSGAEYIDAYNDTMFAIARADSMVVGFGFTDTATKCSNEVWQKVYIKKPQTGNVADRKIEDVVIYPNPSSGVFHVISTAEIQNVQITDASGRDCRVTLTKLDPAHVIVAMDQENSGICFLRINSRTHRLLVIR